MVIVVMGQVRVIVTKGALEARLPTIGGASAGAADRNVVDLGKQYDAGRTGLVLLLPQLGALMLQLGVEIVSAKLQHV